MTQVLSLAKGIVLSWEGILSNYKHNIKENVSLSIAQTLPVLLLIGFVNQL